MSATAIPARLLWIVERPAIDNGALESALSAGIPWLHLRDDSVAPREWHDLLGAKGVPRVVVNGGPAWAKAVGWGAHLKAAQASLTAAQRAAWSLLGRSVHDPGQTRVALRDEPDYLVAGPVYPTSSKPGHRGIGPEGLRPIVDAAGGCPVLAIGGIVPGRVGEVLAAGAFGVSVRSGITAAADAAASVEELLQTLPVDPR